MKKTGTKRRKLQDKRKEKALLIWGVPKELMKSFKIVCALNDVTMKEAVISLLRSFCERGGHKSVL